MASTGSTDLPDQQQHQSQSQSQPQPMNLYTPDTHGNPTPAGVGYTPSAADMGSGTPVSASTATAAGQKRRSQSDVNGSLKKKQRTRVSYSCSECHRRKQKCDRQVPCGHCIARKVPELCKGYTPGKADSDLAARLARVESIIEHALPQYASRLSSLPQTPSDPGDDGGGDEGSVRGDEGPHGMGVEQEDDPQGGILSGGKWYGSSASGSVTTQPLLEQLHAQSGDLGPLEDNASPAEKLIRLIQDCGVSATKMPELLRELPENKQVCDRFVDFYFQHINYTRYPLYEPAFRASYESIYANGGKIHPNDIRFLPLLFVILATAVRLAPDHIVGNSSVRRITSLRYYWASRRSLLIAAAVQTDSLELVLARLLSFRFLVFERRITECWAQLGAAVRTAQALGLHRDGTKLGLDAFNTEYRRRIWTYLYHADRTHALILGRPPSISDDYTDTLPPSNIPDDALPTARIVMPQSEPLTKPTLMTFQILRHNLATIIGHIVHHFQNLRGHSHYSDVVHLDQELENFVANLPPHYSLDPDTSLDHVYHFVPVHRFLIITEVFFVRMSLHRPYLLRRSDRYNLSRQASFKCARLDFRVRQQFKRTVSRDVMSSMGGAYREFQAAMTAGIALVLDPDGPESDAMRQIVDTFVLEHANMGEDLDDTTKRELKVIELLQSKAASGRRLSLKTDPDEPSLNGYSPNGQLDPQTTANILLNISQAIPPPPGVGSPFPTHPVSPTTSHQIQSPSNGYMPYRHPFSQPADGPGAYAQSPFQRIVERPQSTLSNGAQLSPTDDESAQALLDKWCDTAQGSTTAGLTAGGWSLGDGLGQPMSLEASLGLQDSMATSSLGVPQEEWSYWDNLVETIRGSSVVSAQGSGMG